MKRGWLERSSVHRDAMTRVSPEAARETPPATVRGDPQLVDSCLVRQHSIPQRMAPNIGAPPLRGATSELLGLTNDLCRHRRNSTE